MIRINSKNRSGRFSSYTSHRIEAVVTVLMLVNPFNCLGQVGIYGGSVPSIERQYAQLAEEASNSGFAYTSVAEKERDLQALDANIAQMERAGVNHTEHHRAAYRMAVDARNRVANTPVDVGGGSGAWGGGAASRQLAAEQFAQFTAQAISDLQGAVDRARERLRKETAADNARYDKIGREGVAALNRTAGSVMNELDALDAAERSRSSTRSSGITGTRVGLTSDEIEYAAARDVIQDRLSELSAGAWQNPAMRGGEVPALLDPELRKDLTAPASFEPLDPEDLVPPPGVEGWGSDRMEIVPVDEYGRGSELASGINSNNRNAPVDLALKEEIEMEARSREAGSGDGEDNSNVTALESNEVLQNTQVTEEMIAVTDASPNALSEAGAATPVVDGNEEVASVDESGSAMTVEEFGEERMMDGVGVEVDVIDATRNSLVPKIGATIDSSTGEFKGSGSVDLSGTAANAGVVGVVGDGLEKVQVSAGNKIVQVKAGVELGVDQKTFSAAAQVGEKWTFKGGEAAARLESGGSVTFHEHGRGYNEAGFVNRNTGYESVAWKGETTVEVGVKSQALGTRFSAEWKIIEGAARWETGALSAGYGQGSHRRVALDALEWNDNITNRRTPPTLFETIDRGNYYRQLYNKSGQARHLEQALESESAAKVLLDEIGNTSEFKHALRERVNREANLQAARGNFEEAGKLWSEYHRLGRELDSR